MMDLFHPVLIGSFAACQNNLKIDDISDYDVLCLEGTAFSSIIHKGKILNPDVQYVKTDSDKIIYYSLLEHSRIAKFNDMTFRIPTNEILLAILTSHIHRIIPVTPYQSQNIEVWYKKVSLYNLLRSSLDYKTFDEKIKLNNNLISKLFWARFNETNQKFGDTHIDLNMTKDQFFDDNVVRYIDHDELHKKVALANRNTPDPIYKKLQKSGNDVQSKSNDFDSRVETKVSTVQLDEKLFFQLTREEKTINFREEIMVLFLERIMIPNAKENITLNYEFLCFQMRELIAHFVTDLCGNGYSWLRKYAIDHLFEFSDPTTYDFNMLFRIVNECNINSNVNKINSDVDDNVFVNQSMIAFNELLTKTNNTNKTCRGQQVIRMSVKDGGFSYKIYDIYKKEKFVKFALNKKHLLFNSHDKLYDFLLDCDTGEFIMYDYIFDDFTTGMLSIFFTDEEQDTHIFRKVHIEGSVDTAKVDVIHSIMVKYSVYFSSGCEYTQRVNPSVAQQYLSSFGTIDHRIKPIMELFSRALLQLDPSKKVVENNSLSPYSSEWEFYDSKTYSDLEYTDSDEDLNSDCLIGRAEGWLGIENYD